MGRTDAGGHGYWGQRNRLCSRFGSKAFFVLTPNSSLGLQVVAEGVETEARRALLPARGCDLAQGFLFDKTEVRHLFTLTSKPVSGDQSCREMPLSLLLCAC